MVQPVRAALVGAGLVGQVAHLRTLTAPDSPIRLAAVIDASPGRARSIGATYGVPGAASLQALGTAGLDAVVIAAPDPYHGDLAREALAAGLHVFIEKPLALTAAEAEGMQSAGQAASRICQVGYMKRFDPAARTLMADLRERGSRITGIGVEVRDPDASPFVRDVPFVPADDLPPDAARMGQDRLIAAVAQILGRTPTPDEVTGYASYISALVHDLNLSRMMVPGPLAVEAGFMSMAGLQVGMHLRAADGTLIRMTHTQDTTIADYQERFVVYTTRGVYELVFPAPYLLHHPTALRRIDPKDASERSAIVDLNASTEEAFVLELHAFAEAIAQDRDAPIENSFADAVEDLRLLQAAFTMAAMGTA